MKTLPVLMIATFVSAGLSSFAQDKKQQEQTDSTIMSDVVKVAQLLSSGEEPDWAAITTKIKSANPNEDAERITTKSQIYFYYKKDNSKFCAALVRYTDAYEDKNDGKLMNKNARYILSNSQDKTELQKALGWMKVPLKNEPDNQDYAKTSNDLIIQITKFNALP